MKKQFAFATLSVLFLLMLSSGCKKDAAFSNKSTPANDTAFKSKIWVGEFNYDGSGPEPMSIEFGADSTLTWHERLGDFKGVWQHVNGQLKISLNGTVSFTGTIAGDNTLTGIVSTDAGKRILQKAALNDNTDQTLDNTTWTGVNIVMKFKPGNLVDLTLASASFYTDLPYTRQGKAIRFNASPDYKWFIVSTDDLTMDGSNTFAPDTTVYGFTIKKQ